MNSLDIEDHAPKTIKDWWTHKSHMNMNVLDEIITMYIMYGYNVSFVMSVYVIGLH